MSQHALLLALAVSASAMLADGVMEKVGNDGWAVLEGVGVAVDFAVTELVIVDERETVFVSVGLMERVTVGLMVGLAVPDVVAELLGVGKDETETEAEGEPEGVDSSTSLGEAEALAAVEGVTDAEAEPSRATLYKWGNVSSSSVWYELAFIEAFRGVKRGDKVWQLSFGSGFKCNSAVWTARRSFKAAHACWEGFDAEKMRSELAALTELVAAERAVRHARVLGAGLRARGEGQGETAGGYYP